MLLLPFYLFFFCFVSFLFVFFSSRHWFFFSFFVWLWEEVETDITDHYASDVSVVFLSLLQLLLHLLSFNCLTAGGRISSLWCSSVEKWRATLPTGPPLLWLGRSLKALRTRHLTTFDDLAGKPFLCSCPHKIGTFTHTNLAVTRSIDGSFFLLRKKNELS